MTAREPSTVEGHDCAEHQFCDDLIAATSRCAICGRDMTGE